MRLISAKFIGFSLAAVATISFLSAFSAGAASYSVAGSIRMFNPSAGALNLGAQVGREGQLITPRPTTHDTVNQTASGLIQLPEKLFQLDGWPDAKANGSPDSRLRFRSFPVFACCAQLTYESKTYNEAATLGNGLGAGNIQWCPKATGCANFSAGTLKPARVAYQAGANQFGGVVRLLRSVTGQIFFIKAQTPTLSISLQPNTLVAGNPALGGLFSGGLTNFATVMDVNNAGDLYTGGALTQMDGVIQTLGAFAGPATVPNDGTATGFKVTTGVIVVSDATPATAQGGPFSSTISGYDNRDGSGNGTIKLVGSSVAYNGSTGNNFFRTSRFYLNLPAPGTSLGLAAGMFTLLALAHVRRRK